jgi:hypothetical protein
VVCGLGGDNAVSGNISILCVLNAAGRKYVKEQNTLLNGVEVLTTKVSENELGGLFLLSLYFFHLRENVHTFFGNEGAAPKHAGSKRKQREEDQGE